VQSVATLQVHANNRNHTQVATSPTELQRALA
jgi:hypothetical protein